jgi:hypothetical protein
VVERNDLEAAELGKRGQIGIVPDFRRELLALRGGTPYGLDAIWLGAETGTQLVSASITSNSYCGDASRNYGTRMNDRAIVRSTSWLPVRFLARSQVGKEQGNALQFDSSGQLMATTRIAQLRRPAGLGALGRSLQEIHL